MPEDRLNLFKKEITSVIITYPNGVSLENFCKAYRQLLGRRLPAREFGFTTDLDFLFSLQDVVRVRTGINGEYQLTCIANESIQHIQKLVSKQRTAKPNITQNSRHVMRRPAPQVITNNNNKPYVSASLRVNLFKVLQNFPDGLTYGSLLMAYRKQFNRPLNLEFLSSDSNEILLKLTVACSELKVINTNNCLRLFYCPLPIQKETASSEVAPISPKKPPITCIDKIVTEKAKDNSKSTEISAIPEVVKDYFKKVLILYPSGVLAKYFPFLYEKISGEVFDVLDFGYSNIVELADAVPEIFICIKSYENPNDWMLFHTIYSENAAQFKEANKELGLRYKSHKINGIEKQSIPSDVSSPTVAFTSPQFPSDLDLTLYIPVFISAVKDPSCFWFKLQVEEVICKFRDLEEEMQCFYHSCNGDKYEMNTTDINIGSACVAMIHDHWYRVVVISSPINEIVKAYLVDYGSWEEVDCSQLRYLKKSFVSLPAQAFKGQLASVKPPNDVKNWSKRAEIRFSELCDSSFIMARVHSKFKESVSILLCDTSGVDDVHMNDTLVDEGLAECDVTDSTSSADEGIQVDSDNVEEDNVQENISLLSFNKENVSKACNGITQNNSSENVKLIKRISTSDGYKFHLILVSNEIFVSAKEMCSLFWSDKPIELLKERLKLKNIEIHVTTILKEDNEILFQQCEHYSIQGFKETQHSVELYSLAFAMRILNILGHPSDNVRKKIKVELERTADRNIVHFSTDDEDEFSSSNINSGINKYCLYDLKALYEGVQCKKLKSQKVYNETNCEDNLKEMMKFDALSEVIKNRIDYIKSLCTSYSAEIQ